MGFAALLRTRGLVAGGDDAPQPRRHWGQSRRWCRITNQFI